ncbi:conserved exported hypothetical protein [Frankia canadensis]|uniref:Peptidase inhibitor family I36 n=1 Tax=Frankia canadensis TaxID=1836972 RepID=A0A2I2KS98_9ACTN|nr:peptidase inhibitor family I36 protein [Frankia canadensis]SNQ48532.1 conserved exported hypothetical protein [Frankia canadensis]SOU55822.1 conserved exported hypothetical protein [Frankia canadensis]
MTGTSIRRRLAVAAGSVAAAGLVAVGLPAQGAQAKTSPTTPPPASTSDTTARNSAGASAKHLDGACNRLSSGTGDLCLWYFSNFGGSFSDFFFADSNLNDNVFIAQGAGQGQRVGNNTMSAVNFDNVFTAQLWTGTNYTGASLNIPAGSGNSNLGGFNNNVESFKWI